jgi:hypothetical protein
VTIKDVDYEKNEIKDAYPKTVCHMPKSHNKKKERRKRKKKRKRCIPKEDMPHAHKACRKKKKDCPHPRKINKRDESC